MSPENHRKRPKNHGELINTIAEFQIAHDYSVDDQFKVLIEELGELSEALLQNDGKKIGKDNSMGIEEIQEEIGDVRYTLDTIALLCDIDPLTAEYQIALENAEKWNIHIRKAGQKER